MQYSHWLDHEYLRHGNPRQQLCYKVLSETNIINLLAEFSPIVIGTFPIEIDVAGSDLDIACYAPSPDLFCSKVRSFFNNEEGFKDRLYDNHYLACFSHNSVEIEIYAEPKSTFLQNGFRHMVIEDRILKIAGNEFREAIIKLKAGGLKTEPAFGVLFQMNEPYTELLNLYDFSDRELSQWVSNNLYMEAWHKLK